MIGHKKLLPLAETETENPSELTIKLFDIWFFERSQLHNIPSYDKDFALQLLDKIEQRIAGTSEPDFVVDLNAKEESYQLNKQAIHSSKCSNIKERFALDYFFVLDNCYSYSKEIALTSTDAEFLYWFSLKLRQYDLNLNKVNDFLNFQLNEYSNQLGQDFIEVVSLSLLQHPDFFSDRLLQTVNVWRNKIEKEAVSLIVAQTDNVLKSSINRPSRAFPKFTWKEHVNKEKQLIHLHESLISHGYIGKIELSDFKKHFNGIFENIPAIDWKTNQYGLIYLINQLKPYLNPELYKGKDNSIVIAYFERHFHYQGKPLNISSWRKVKSDKQGIENEFTNSIDLIISHL
jgi:hypothetical protein